MKNKLKCEKCRKPLSSNPRQNTVAYSVPRKNVVKMHRYHKKCWRCPCCGEN